MSLNFVLYRFYSSFVTSSGEMFYQLRRALQLNLRTKGAEKMPSFAKKRLIRKKFKSYYLCSNQKLASTQTFGSAFLDRIRKIQNLKYESDLFKNIDCFFDCHGSVNGDYVSFVTKKSIVFKCALKIYTDKSFKTKLWFRNTFFK